MTEKESNSDEVAKEANEEEEDPDQTELFFIDLHLTQYKSGRVERVFDEYKVKPGLDPETGVNSKDVHIKYPNDLMIPARLYLPKDATPENKYPIVIYFHGGSFITECPFSMMYHKYLNGQVEQTNAVTVSWGYRIAPEHHLPIAYEDAWRALKWIAATKQEWITEYGDLNSVFLGGDDAGANIAHSVAMRFGSEKIEGVNLTGMFLSCPLFWGKERVGNEEQHSKFDYYLPTYSNIWRCAYPTMNSFDDVCINAAMDPKLSTLPCKRVLIYVAGNDFLRDRGLQYGEALSKSGWGGEVEVVDIAYEMHNFNVKQRTANGGNMLKKVGCFVNGVPFDTPPSTIGVFP